mmetsp:Transcript_23320/g.31194  ORF Transcript_23320/g.31194 Transcript_23320/m.31194 type:complete len:320 (-) Transcript_23320:556-1515(-)
MQIHEKIEIEIATGWLGQMVMPLKVWHLSLEELRDLGLLAVLEERIDPIRDHRAGLLKLGRICVGRRVQLDAVATVVAVGDACNLVERLVRLHLGGPLPGVLDTVGKEYVGHGDVPAALIDGRLLSLRLFRHTFTEGALAHIVPEARLEHSGAHDVLLARHLEPTVLRAVLESPGAGRAHNINGRLGDLACVIVSRVDVGDIVAEIGHQLHNLVAARILILLEHIAHPCPVAILNGLERDVSVEEHPIVGAHTLGASTRESLIDDGIGLAGVASLTLRRHILHRVLDHLGAVVAALNRRLVSLLVELPEVDDRLHHTGG